MKTGKLANENNILIIKTLFVDNRSHLNLLYYNVYVNANDLHLVYN